MLVFEPFIDARELANPSLCSLHLQFVAVYHQCRALNLTKPQKRYRLARDEIQSQGADDILGFAVMIYQTCGLSELSIEVQHF